MAQRQIASDFKNLQKDPVEGFLCVPDESNFFVWKIYIEGPKDTPFERGIFEMKMEFPQDYPMSPPTLHFISEFYHPNVYKDGKVCISILHPPGHDATSGELPEERWLPTQTVSTIILSVLSILGDPNLSSPANVDASVCWRDNRKKFTQIAAKLVEKANARVPPDVKIPHPESNPVERDALIQKRKQEMNRDLFDNDDVDDDLELCSDFPDDDEDPIEETPEPSQAKKHSKKPTKDSTDKKASSPDKKSKPKSSHKKKSDETKKSESKPQKTSPKKETTEKKESKKLADDKKAENNNKEAEKPPTEEKEAKKDKKTKSTKTKSSTQKLKTATP